MFHCCQFIIRTDPKNADYEFVEGIRKKVRISPHLRASNLTSLHTHIHTPSQDETYTSADTETIDISEEKRDEIRAHPIMQLEKQKADKAKAIINRDRYDNLINSC